MTSLAEALRTARLAKGLTRTELADLTDLTQASISRYELGERTPSPETLARLASALGVTVGFLDSVDKLQGAWAIDAHLRRRATAQARVWRRLEARLNMLRNHARYLYEEIEIRADQSVPRYDPEFTRPSDAARFTRMQWRLPVGPVRFLTGWIEAAGCLVIEEDFGTERVDGLSQWVGDHPLILLNRDRPTDRKRLTLAHELGHLCLHTAQVGDDDVEQEANEFASEFLMPADIIRPQLRNLTLGKLPDLKRTWGVSMQAIIECAYRVGTIRASERSSLYKQVGARGWRKQEPGSKELIVETPKLATEIGRALAARGLNPIDIASLAGFAPDSKENPFVASDPDGGPLDRHLRLA